MDYGKNKIEIKLQVDRNIIHITYTGSLSREVFTVTLKSLFFTVKVSHSDSQISKIVLKLR